MTKARRDILKAGSAGAVTVGAAAVGLPLPALSQPAPIRIGVLHPVTGPLAYSGQQCREGAMMAIDAINQGGGVKSLGGARIEPVIGDAQSRPAVGAAEIEKMHQDGVAAVIGAYASAICLATTQAAARYDLPHVVDIGVADAIVERGLKNTFRFGPGYKACSEIAVQNLHILNTVSGKPARTVMIIHEESLFGTGTANQLQEQLPQLGYQVVDVVKHANPTRDFNNIVLRMKSLAPDIVIPANYYNEYALLVRTMKQQKVAPKAVYSVLGGAASSFKFVKEFPDVAEGIIDCNHWYNPRDKRALDLRKAVQARGLFYTYEIFNTYAAMQWLASAIEQAGSADRAAITTALAASTWSGHFMPYGPTKVVNGQNTGAMPLMTQVLKGDIRVIVPKEYADTAPVFPWRAGA